jgi:hypothetical protein
VVRRSLLARAVGLALVLAAVGGCGRKTDVKPPQLVAPQAIAELAAENEAAGIRLRWERPRAYVDGTSMNDLAGFRIERRRGAEEFAELVRIEVEDRYRFQQVRRFRYLDTKTEVGLAYEYRVYCFTLDGYESAASNLVQIARAIPPVGEKEQESKP